MVTMAYDFKPWDKASYFGSGQDILDYLNEAIDENDLRKKIKCDHRVTKSAYESAQRMWTLSIEGKKEIKSKFVIFGIGYYSYAKPHRPTFTNEEAFPKDKIIHAQNWPKDYDVKGKTVAVIGSGATAVTLIPELAKTAEKVIMVQRSPGYVFAAPLVGPGAWLKPYVPRFLYHWLRRYYDVFDKLYSVVVLSLLPVKGRTAHKNHVKDMLGDSYQNFDALHFQPKYDLWDQRVCVAPAGDFYKALKTGKADIVTGHIKCFTDNGIKMVDRHLVKADLIVLATGLNMELNLNIVVDGKRLNEGDLMIYRQTFLSDVPNCAILFGSTIASWTLSLGPAMRFVCKQLQYMKRNLSYFLFFS